MAAFRTVPPFVNVHMFVCAVSDYVEKADFSKGCRKQIGGGHAFFRDN